MGNGKMGNGEVDRHRADTYVAGLSSTLSTTPLPPLLFPFLYIHSPSHPLCPPSSYMLALKYICIKWVWAFGEAL